MLNEALLIVLAVAFILICLKRGVGAGIGFFLKWIFWTVIFTIPFGIIGFLAAFLFGLWGNIGTFMDICIIVGTIIGYYKVYKDAKRKLTDNNSAKPRPGKNDH